MVWTGLDASPLVSTWTVPPQKFGDICTGKIGYGTRKANIGGMLGQKYFEILETTFP